MLILAIAVVIAGAGVTQAATTISTNILTGGTLGVTGASTLTGAVTANGALNVVGISTFGATASTTISTAGVLTAPSATVNGALGALSASFGATASTTISTAGVVSMPSTLSVTGLATLLGGATTTQLTLLNGETITNATDGVVTVGTADLFVTPNGSSNGRIWVHPTLNERETGNYINQAIKADVTLGSTFGASDTSDEWFGSAIRSRVMGSNLTGANNTIGALEGSYYISGTNASVYPKGAVLGEIGNNSTTADGAFVAYTDGDVGTLNKAGAAFKVMNNNNAASGSKFNYGLDIFDAGHAGLAAVTVGVADIRLVNGDTISNTAASTTVMSGAFRAASLNFANATAVAGTGDAITIDFTPDFPALAAGEEVTFISEAANTTAVTLAIDGGTAKAITKTGGAFAALVANDIKSGQVVKVVYDGTRWEMISPLGQ